MKYQKLTIKTSALACVLLLSACGSGSTSSTGIGSEQPGGTPGIPSEGTPTNPGSGTPSNPGTGIPDKPTVPVPPVQNSVIVVDGKTFTSPSEAENAIQNNSLVQFGSGVFTQGMTIRPDNVKLVGSDGTHFKGAQVQNKATFVIAGDNVSMDNIECSGVSVPNENGACIRQEGKDLRLSGVYFHDSEQGILTAKNTGSLIIEYSTFERLGKAGYAHAVYSANDRLEIRYSKFYRSKDNGHEIKSRAKETLIEYSEIASLDSADSRLVDISNGGKLTIRNSLLEQGPNTANFQVIGFGMEGIDQSVPQSVELTNNIILMERQKGNVLLGLPSDSSSVQISITGNNLIGTPFNDKAEHNIQQNNNIYDSRSAYGLGAFPELPSIGL
ncbi:right-handed parallel beta-helix repeat-containing protein [Photobacterium chitinilyticum]|uniref:Right-handed parallel beta-helix repeat-containing protein n=1 Tax=Photobacterium chitinilyticum TaxID=2485123 RepID=A0A444JSR5_9GAMM|nr:right-handed parallel beta-helix repeat-containing protein [Photobacterium chitinilyticum]RWX56096.1 hypothetical protein EDI28_07340 [Photobacterium chitinilyticum]